MKLVLVGILILFLLAGCAQLRSIFAPQEPASMPPAKPGKAPAKPPEEINLQVSPAEEKRLVSTIQEEIQRAENELRLLDAKKMSAEVKEIFNTVVAFISQARMALNIKDYSQALNLARKARLLAEELRP